MRSDRPHTFVLASALLAIAMLASPAVDAATITVINNDGVGEGFNDPTPAAPVGGNTGTTIGAQRLSGGRAWGAGDARGLGGGCAGRPGALPDRLPMT